MTTSKPMNDQTKPKQGGVRANSGRPAVDGAKNVKNVSVAVNDTQRAFLKAKGGSVWVRKMIDATMAAEARAADRKKAPR